MHLREKENSWILEFLLSLLGLLECFGLFFMRFVDKWISSLSKPF